MPGHSHGPAREVGEQRQVSGHSTAFLGKLLAQRQPPQLWGCSDREEQWLQMGLRPGAGTDVSWAALTAILRCHQDRQKLCACRNCFGLGMLVLQSDSAQSLCLAFRGDLP